jgi:hypothetical protein
MPQLSASVRSRPVPVDVHAERATIGRLAILVAERQGRRRTAGSTQVDERRRPRLVVALSVGDPG